ncbi:MAG: hypothetical protein HY922_15065 [Elusimicrobia bacterium]|nr:hypothetical protein [Elusimicrobiota bacterium]
MSRSNEPRVWEDVWFQVFSLIAIVSGVFTAHYYMRQGGLLSLPGLLRPAPASPAPAPEDEIPFTEAPSASPAPATPPAASAAGPKTPGRWIVDPRMGAGADCASLTAALAGARDGDAITLRPGIYREGVHISKSVAITGGGSAPDQVQLTHAGPQTVAVYGAQVALKNLSLSNTGSRGYWVVTVMKAGLSLSDVGVRSDGQGVRVMDGTLEASGGELDARIALAVEGKSRATLIGAALSGTEAGVVAGGEGAAVRIEKSKLQECGGPAVEASRFAKVMLSEVFASRNSQAVVFVRSGAEVRVSRSTFTDNRDCGARIDGGVLVLESVALMRGRCGVAFIGAGSLDAKGSEFSALELGALAIRPGLEKEIVVRGSGNTGLRIPTVQKKP